VKEARLANPLLFFQQFSVHDHDLTGGPAKADKPSFSKKRKASPKLGCRARSDGTPPRLSGQMTFS
jgi:hypothetical protein